MEADDDDDVDEEEEEDGEAAGGSTQRSYTGATHASVCTLLLHASQRMRMKRKTKTSSRPPRCDCR